MDYFNDVFITFLGLASCNEDAVYGRIRKDHLDFIKYILICVLDEQGLTGLDRHEGE